MTTTLIAGIGSPHGADRLGWAVIEALLSSRGRVLSKQVLEERLYAFDDAIEGNAVEVYVSRLRAKLGAEVIETRRGLGYLVP